MTGLRERIYGCPQMSSSEGEEGFMGVLNLLTEIRKEVMGVLN